MAKPSAGGADTSQQPNTYDVIVTSGGYLPAQKRAKKANTAPERANDPQWSSRPLAPPMTDKTQVLSRTLGPNINRAQALQRDADSRDLRLKARADNAWPELQNFSSISDLLNLVTSYLR